jgi:hypothetical protein
LLHDKGRSTNGDEIVELVRHRFGWPAQCTEQDVPNLVEGQIEDVRLNVTGQMRRPKRPGRRHLGLPFDVKPLDEDGRVDEQPSHDRLSRSARTKSADSKAPDERNRSTDRAIAASIASGVLLASSRRAAVANKALRLVDRRFASSSI